MDSEGDYVIVVGHRHMYVCMKCHSFSSKNRSPAFVIGYNDDNKFFNSSSFLLMAGTLLAISVPQQEALSRS